MKSDKYSDKYKEPHPDDVATFYLMVAVVVAFVAYMIASIVCG